ncbi:MAG: PRC-barrel domain-containing protein [Candidatus Thorarchaeota archaeon]|nr:PRC-barrel domain-containing protein [Candidatus Thorarchaeota archaeon]
MPYKCCGIRFSQMMKKNVVDSTGKDIGKVNDFIISYTPKSVTLKSIVLGGGRIEEFLESIGLRPDVDPVFQMDCISQIQDEIVLITEGEKLKTTLDEGTIGEGDMRLSKFSKLPIMDSDGMKVGNVIDVWFDINGEPWLVVAGGIMEEVMERLSVLPDIDLLIPMQFLDNISEKEIKLKYTKFQLESTCEDEYDKYKRETASQYEPSDYRYESLRFHPKGQGLM